MRKFYSYLLLLFVLLISSVSHAVFPANNLDVTYPCKVVITNFDYDQIGTAFGDLYIYDDNGNTIFEVMGFVAEKYEVVYDLRLAPGKYSIFATGSPTTDLNRNFEVPEFISNGHWMQLSVEPFQHHWGFLAGIRQF